MEVIHRKGISITLAVEPDIPQEKRIYDFRVTFQVSVEIQYKTVVQCGLHTYFVKTFGKAVIVFDSVCVGLEYVLVPVDLSGSVRGSLQQEIIVTVDTGNQASSQFLCIQRIHQHHLLPFCQGGGGRKHHLEIMFVIFKFFEQRTPECDIIIAFYISNDTSARLLRVEFMGSVEVRRSQVIS